MDGQDVDPRPGRDDERGKRDADRGLPVAGGTFGRKPVRCQNSSPRVLVLVGHITGAARKGSDMTQRLIIAGGGLSGVLTAMAFATHRPDIELTVLEAGPTLGGDHTWSFYETDLEGAASELVAPFVT